MSARGKAQPPGGSKSAERDAAENDPQNQRERGGMTLDEQEQEAKPDDFQGEEREPREEGGRQPPCSGAACRRRT